MTLFQHVWTPVTRLKVGDFVDLLNDPYADPQRDQSEESMHRTYMNEYTEIRRIFQEKNGWLVIEFEGRTGEIAFPMDHELSVHRKV